LSQEGNYETALESGQLDLVIGNWPESSKRLHRRDLFTDEVVCLVSKNHPFAKTGLSEADYLRAAHLAPTPFLSAQRGTIDTHLARVRLKRNITVMIPYFSQAPALLLKTDLVFTITRRFAEYHARFLPLVVLDSPIDFPPVQYYILWHPRSHLSDEVQWLIGLIAGCI
ncbi:MAG TPA: LysR substrate-binding domain-containing protein, partial [Acidiphilium sp.]